MIPEIKLLFVGPPSKASVENQKLLLIETLPISGHFIERTMETLSYLSHCHYSIFPDVIILDSELGEQPLQTFLHQYRNRFYLRHMDSLLYVSGATIFDLEPTDRSPILTGYLCKPLTKTVFLKEIFPRIAFKMV